MKRILTILLAAALAACWGCAALAEGEEPITTTEPAEASMPAVEKTDAPAAAPEPTAAPAVEEADAPAVEPETTVSGEAPADAPQGARAVFASAAELYGSWAGQYPDYVCGVWSNDGTMDDMTIAVVSEDAKAQVLKQLEPGAKVTLTVMKYPYYDLRAIQEALTSQMGDETGIIGLGVLEMENVLEVTLLDGNPHAADTARELASAYGDRVKTVMSGPIAMMEELGPEPAPAAGAGSTSRRWAWLLLPFGFALALLSYSLLRRRAAAQTHAGTVEAEETDPVTRQVQEAQITPSARLDEKILEAARKK